MKNTTIVKSVLSMAISSAMFSGVVMAEDIAKATVDMRVRYESVEQDNALSDADALTLRTRVKVVSKEVDGFSGVIEFEDSRPLFGVEDYNNTIGAGVGNSVVADPEVTEVDQAFVQYKYSGLTATVGRQVMTFDGHRFVGHVGFRQDRQTFDGIDLNYQASKDLALRYAHITKRNRIFAEEKDIDSNDHLLHLSYATGLGKLTAYSYLLETDAGPSNSLDSYGVSFKGKQKLEGWSLLYDLEYASQSSERGAADFDADYTKVELGAVAGGITAKLGYELLGSDDGQYGFSTPLATLHKFNGWTDQFLATPKQGLEDVYVSLGGKALGGKWLAVYHDFSADESAPGINDLGSELGVQFVKPFAKRYSVGVKYAMYEAGDAAAGKVDTDKLWVWLGAKF